ERRWRRCRLRYRRPGRPARRYLVRGDALCVSSWHAPPNSGAFAPPVDLPLAEHLGGVVSGRLQGRPGPFAHYPLAHHSTRWSNGPKLVGRALPPQGSLPPVESIPCKQAAHPLGETGRKARVCPHFEQCFLARVCEYL